MTLTAANIVENIYNDRVLLMENDPTMRAVYEEHLEFSGYEVHVACTMAEAHNVLEYVPVNLIVTNEFIEGNINTVPFINKLRQDKIGSSILVLSENEDRVWDQMPDDEMALQTFPIPKDLDEFFRTDINQFVSIINMVLDGMKCVLSVNDSHAEMIQLENLLITNNYRICSVKDGLRGLEMLEKAKDTRKPVDLIIMDVVNRYQPGFMFLEDLSRRNFAVPAIVLTTLNIDSERVKAKTNYEISHILHKKKIDTDLIQLIQQTI